MPLKNFCWLLCGASLLLLLSFSFISVAPEGERFFMVAMLTSGLGVVLFGSIALILRNHPATHWVHESNSVYLAILAAVGTLIFITTIAGL
jgi:hypothetical protein